MPVQAQSIGELQNKQKEINNSLNSNQNALSKNTALKNSTVNKLKEINDNIHNTESKILSLNNQITEQQAQIDKTNKQIEESQLKLEKAQNTLKDRVVTIYEEGNVNYLDVLLQAKSFSDFLTQFEYLTYISKKDRAIVVEIEDVKKNLETQKSTLESQMNTLSSLKKDQETVQALLQQQQSEQTKIYKQLESNEEALKEKIASMEAASQNIGQQIAQLQAEAARAQGSATFSNSNKAPVIYSGSGGWPAPASRVITSRYGPRVYPFGGYDFHLGIDIGAPYGSPVVSFRDGTVILAAYHWSYGNYVVVDHGNGLSTLYAHMSSINTNVGQHLSQGQQLGSVGSSGSSTGAHLHFEVRINGLTVDPAPYLGV